VLLAALVVFAACGDPAPSGGSGVTGASPSAAGPPPTPPTTGAFWSMASRAIGATQRLRVIVVGGSPDELRFEPRASASVTEGELTTVCIEGRAYDIDGFEATQRDARWTCGVAAFVASFRRSGQPREAWNGSVPEERAIRERVVAGGSDRWRWEYSARAADGSGTVQATLLMDAETGRLLSGTRRDPSGDVRWTFNYTGLFTPVQLP
jgi:hypothetical protein